MSLTLSDKLGLSGKGQDGGCSVFPWSPKNLRVCQPFPSSLLETGPLSWGSSIMEPVLLLAFGPLQDERKKEGKVNKEQDGRLNPTMSIIALNANSLNTLAGDSARDSWKCLGSLPGRVCWGSLAMSKTYCLDLYFLQKEKLQIISDILIFCLTSPGPHHCGPVEITWTRAQPGVQPWFCAQALVDQALGGASCSTSLGSSPRKQLWWYFPYKTLRIVWRTK